MKKRILFFLMFVITTISYSQDYKTEFESLFNQGKKEEILPLINNWEKAEPDNPEMYIAYFNYYFMESQNEVIQLDTKNGPDNNLQILDTATQETVGYMYSKMYYGDSLFNIAQEYIKKGILKNPRRLDMYFGRIFTLREKGLYELHCEEILNVIELNKQINSEWLWSNNEKLEDSENFFKGSIQDYNYALFNLEEPRTIEIEKISSRMKELYPNDIENYSNLGVCKLMNSEFDQALEIFLEANKVNSEDAIVISNIAYTYMQLSNFKKSKEYYNLVIEKGNQKEVDFAKYMIEQIDNQQ